MRCSYTNPELKQIEGRQGVNIAVHFNLAIAAQEVLRGGSPVC